MLRHLAQRTECPTGREPGERRTEETDPEQKAAAEAAQGPSGNLGASTDDEQEAEPAATRPMRPRLAVGSADDPQEEEADTIADKVTRTPARGHPVDSVLNRGKELQSQPAATRTAVGEVPAIVQDVLRSPGRPLDASTLAYIEPRFGHGFRDVRIHANARAALSARSIHAAAYTVGNHVVFDAGRYEPHAPQGRWLLSHELAHVVQQRASATAATVLRRQPSGSRPTYGNLYPEDVQPSARIVRLEKVGDIWHEVGPTGARHSAKGNYDFVVRNGEVLAVRHRRSGFGGAVAGHLTLAKGGRVEYAGQVRFGSNTTTKGTVTEWSNASGHIAPTGGGLDPASERLLDPVPFPREKFRRLEGGGGSKGPQLPVFQPETKHRASAAKVVPTAGAQPDTTPAKPPSRIDLSDFPPDRKGPIVGQFRDGSTIRKLSATASTAITAISLGTDTDISALGLVQWHFEGEIDAATKELEKKYPNVATLRREADLDRLAKAYDTSVRQLNAPNIRLNAALAFTALTVPEDDIEAHVRALRQRYANDGGGQGRWQAYLDASSAFMNAVFELQERVDKTDHWDLPDIAADIGQRASAITRVGEELEQTFWRMMRFPGAWFPLVYHQLLELLHVAGVLKNLGGRLNGLSAAISQRATAYTRLWDDMQRSLDKVSKDTESLARRYRMPMP